MQVTETKTEGLKREFKIAVPADQIEEKVSTRLKELARTIRLAGFRPGKAPVSLLRKKYGPSVTGEVLEKTISDNTVKLMTDKGLRASMQPKIDISSFEEGADLEYTIAVEVLPEIEPLDFSKIKLERLVADFDEAEVDKTLGRLAESFRSSQPVTTKRQAKSGDILIIDFLGKIDGTPFDGGQAENYSLELGSGSFIPGFEDQLVGAKAGDHVEVKLAFPQEYGAEELAGKDALFEVDVKELRVSVPSSIDDEMAKKTGAENLESLRRRITEDLQKELRDISNQRLKRTLLDFLANKCDFEVPEGLLEREAETIWTQFEEQRKSAPDRMDPEFHDKSDDELKADFQDIAVRRVRLGLLLTDVGRLNNIQVSQEDFTRAMMEEARRYPGREQEIFDQYRNSQEVQESLKGPLLEDKVVDFIFEMSSITEKKVSLDKLMKDPDEAPAAKAKARKKKAPAKKAAKKVAKKAAKKK